VPGLRNRTRIWIHTRRGEQRERDRERTETSRQKTPGGRPRCSRNTNARRADPVGAVPVAYCRSNPPLFREKEHRHSGFANDNEPGITIHIT